MKVLITGGYGFIGSHVADRFYKEGDEVFILDNLSTGKQSNITFKHKGYVLSVEDTKCEELFRSNKFDIVIHLAAQVSVAKSMVNPSDDAGANVVGLVNMLDLSRKYDVKKFIFASSAAVYGLQEQLPITEDVSCSPISPYGLSKWTGESYCRKWEELYGLSTLTFRFSNVYGPRQDAHGEGGVISVMMDRLYAGKPLVIHGDGTQTRDFIYVGDVADAIYRSANSYETGVYNLSTNTESSVNDIVSTLRDLHEVAGIEHSDRRQGDIERSVLDNSRLKRDFDWSPLYTLQEGLARTAAYFMKNTAEAQTAATTLKKKALSLPTNGYIRKFLPSLENLLAFSLTAWLTLTQMNSAYGSIDVKLFYITIMGILYGSRQAILSVMLSIGLFTFQKVIDGRDMVSLLYDTDFFFQIAIYLFIGLVVGYAVERKNSQIKQQEQQLIETKEQYEFLESVYDEVREVKDELQQRILNSGDSYGKIYSVTKELESLEPELVFNAAVNVVRKIMNVKSVSIYTVNEYQTYLRLLASSGQAQQHGSKSLKVEDYSYLTTILSTGTMYVNKRLDDHAPLMCAPIYHKDRIAAVLAIDGLSFESFSLYHQNLFRITVDLVSSALNKAFTFIEATEQQRYIQGTMMLQYDLFNEILESKIQAQQQNNMPYLLLKGKVGTADVVDAANRISSLLRETDYISLDDDDHMLILLSNTSAEDAERVIERLSRVPIAFSAVEEE